MKNNLRMRLIQQRALVTYNRSDFEELIQIYFAIGQKHYGVILAVRRPPQEMLIQPINSAIK